MTLPLILALDPRPRPPTPGASARSSASGKRAGPRRPRCSGSWRRRAGWRRARRTDGGELASDAAARLRAFPASPRSGRARRPVCLRGRPEAVGGRGVPSAPSAGVSSGCPPRPRHDGPPSRNRLGQRRPRPHHHHARRRARRPHGPGGLRRRRDPAGCWRAASTRPASTPWCLRHEHPDHISGVPAPDREAVADGARCGPSTSTARRRRSPRPRRLFAVYDTHKWGRRPGAPLLPGRDGARRGRSDHRLDDRHGGRPWTTPSPPSDSGSTRPMPCWPTRATRRSRPPSWIWPRGPTCCSTRAPARFRASTARPPKRPAWRAVPRRVS